jgi:pimeloyl-ACP methyl ester carboxylesterase
VPLVSGHPLWEEFATRTLYQATYGGADFGECLETVRRIGDGDASAWHREWRATADRLADEAAASADGGHLVSAREAYMRAAMYHRTSYLPLFGAPVDARLRSSFDLESEAFAAAIALFDPPMELVEIPFENGSLPALFARTSAAEPRATIVHTNGYDSDLTEMFVAHVPAAIRRGYHVLLFDGPGQGRNLVRDGTTMRPDWENVVRPVIDWVVMRPEVDPGRIVLAGWSFGGFLAPRAAAFEPRLAALIADPGQWDQRDNFVGRLPLSDEQKATFPEGVDRSALDPLEEALRRPDADPSLRWRLLQRGPWVHGTPTLFEYFAEMTRYELSPVAGNIACPTLVSQAENDPIAANADKLLAALTVERKELVRFTAAEGAAGHCEATARRLYHQRVFDWLDEILASPPARPTAEPVLSTSGLVDVLARYLTVLQSHPDAEDMMARVLTADFETGFVGGHVWKGIDGLRDFLSQREGFFDERHEIAEVLAREDGGDEVRARTRLRFFLRRWKEPSPVSEEFTGTCFHSWRVRRVDGQWRVAAQLVERFADLNENAAQLFSTPEQGLNR